MNLFNRKKVEMDNLKGEIENLKKTIVQLSTEKSSAAYLDNFQNNYLNEGYPTDTNYDNLLAIYKRESWVRAAVDVIKRTVISNGFSLVPTKQVTVKEKENIEKDGDIIQVKRLFNYPNEDETMDDILGNISVDLEIYGDSYLEKVRDKNGKIKEIYNLFAPQMRIICDEHGSILAYIQKLDNRSVASNVKTIDDIKNLGYPTWGPKDIVHFNLPHPGDTVYGLSPLESLLLVIECDFWAQLYNKNFFMNDATPRGQLDLGNCSKAQIDRMRAYWKSEMQGSKNAHKTIITEGGAKYTPVGTAPKDMEFLNQRKFNRDEILAVYGVPPGQVCVFEDANRSNAKEQEKNFKARTIVPLQNMIATKINRGILKDMHVSDTIKFKFNPLDIQDEEERAKVNDTYLRNATLTVNEVRAELGKDPVDWGRNPIIKLNETPLEVAAPTAPEASSNIIEDVE